MLRSKPEGAEVYEESAFIGRTPLRIELGAGTGSRTLELRQPGHRTTSVVIDRSGSGDVVVPLPGAPSARPAAGPRRRRPARPTRPAPDRRSGGGRGLL